jgi:hypothetical protein
MPNASSLSRLQRAGQLANDRILDAEVVDLLIHLSFQLRNLPLCTWRGISRRCIRFTGVPRQRPGGEPVLQQIE